jgi:O-antigen ligase
MEGSPLDATVALGLIIVGLVVLVGRQHEVARLVKVNLVAVFFLSYCALSISWSDFPEIAAKRWIRLLGTFITVLIVLTDRDPTEAMKSVLTRVAFVLIPVSVLLIKYYPDLATYYDAWSGMQIVSGVATDKNMLGMMCLVYGSVILFSFLQSVRERKAPGKSRRLVANALVLAMGFWLLHSADSMTALSCFCFASVLIVFSGFFRVARKPAIIHLLVVGILGATAGILFLHVGEAAALEKMGRNPTLTGRTEIWSGLLSVASNPVFGAGYESFYLGDRLQRIWAIGPLLQGVNEAHNGYLETYLNLGWIGIASLVAFIVAGYRNVIVALQRDFDAGRLKLAFFVAAIAYNFTEAGFRTGSSVWFAFLFAALSVPQAPMLKPAQFTKSDRVRNAELKPVTP